MGFINNYSLHPNCTKIIQFTVKIILLVYRLENNRIERNDGNNNNSCPVGGNNVIRLNNNFFNNIRSDTTPSQNMTSGISTNNKLLLIAIQMLHKLE